MRIFITGEKGFIGRNLVERMKLRNNMNFVSGDPKLNDKVARVFHAMIWHSPGEPCVHSNTVFEWTHFFQSNNIDVLIHNAATVGTHVCALNSVKSTLTNVQGTYNIIRAAVDGLKQQKSPKIIAARRSKKVGNITSARETT